MFPWVVSLALLCISCEVTAFDDTALQLALDVFDKSVVQTFFKKEGNQELLNYINKYKQLFLQVIRIIKKIDNVKKWVKIKEVLHKLKFLKFNSLSKLNLKQEQLKEKLSNIGLNQDKMKKYIPKLPKEIGAVEDKVASLLENNKVNKFRSVTSEAMYMMSKLYTMFVYTNSLLKNAAIPQVFRRTEQKTSTAVAA